MNSQECTLFRSVLAGFQRRVRGTAGPSRVIAVALAAGAALLALTGCMTAVSKADVADVIVIAATATANEPAPALSLADVTLLQTTAGSSTSAVAFVVNPANGEPVQLALTPLPLPQQTTLASYWLAICHAAGAAACRVDDSPRPVRGLVQHGAGACCPGPGRAEHHRAARTAAVARPGGPSLRVRQRHPASRR